MSNVRGLRSKPIRTVLWWQCIATAILAVVAGLSTGRAGAISAALGGLVSLASGIASAWVAGMGKADSAGGVLLLAMRAEAVKIGLIVVLLWLVMAGWRQLETAWFLGTFAVTVVVFSMALFVRDEQNKQR